MFSYDKQHNMYFYAKLKKIHVAFQITLILNTKYFECIIVQSVSDDIIFLNFVALSYQNLCSSLTLNTLMPKPRTLEKSISASVHSSLSKLRIDALNCSFWHFHFCPTLFNYFFKKKSQSKIHDIHSQMKPLLVFVHRLAFSISSLTFTWFFFFFITL